MASSSSHARTRDWIVDGSTAERATAEAGSTKLLGAVTTRSVTRRTTKECWRVAETMKEGVPLCTVWCSFESTVIESAAGGCQGDFGKGRDLSDSATGE